MTKIDPRTAIPSHLQDRGTVKATGGRKDAAAAAPGSGVAVEVTLSDQAKAYLAKNAKESHGKPVAHQARAALALDDFKALAGMPFGKIVSALARGIDLHTLLPQTPAQTGTGEGSGESGAESSTENSETVASSGSGTPPEPSAPPDAAAGQTEPPPA